jgi:hypothetical protein
VAPVKEDASNRMASVHAVQPERDVAGFCVERGEDDVWHRLKLATDATNNKIEILPGSMAGSFLHLKGNGRVAVTFMGPFSRIG